MYEAVITVSGYEFNVVAVTLGSSAGVVLDPQRHNLDDPDCLRALKEALEAYPSIITALAIADDAYMHCRTRKTEAEVQGIFESISDDDLSRLAQDCEITRNQSYIEITADMRLFMYAIQYEVECRQTRAIQKAAKEKSRATKKSGYVYLLESATGHYKIGRTIDPDNRIRTFGVKLPFEVEYACIIGTSDMYGLEMRLHNLYAQKRVNGEWFDLEIDDVAYIKSLAGGAS